LALSLLRNDFFRIFPPTKIFPPFLHCSFKKILPFGANGPVVEYMPNMYFLGDERDAAMGGGGGAQRPVLHVNEPKWRVRAAAVKAKLTLSSSYCRLCSKELIPRRLNFTQVDARLNSPNSRIPTGV
jgi:hypothetical protein